MNKQGAVRGVLWLLALIALFAFAYSFYVRSNSIDLYAYNLTSFQKDLEDGKISTVVVKQNNEVPTGVVSVVADGAEQSFYAPDVNEIIHMVQEKNTETDDQQSVLTVGDVTRQSTLSQILPYIILVVVVIVFMFMMIKKLSK